MKKIKSLVTKKPSPSPVKKAALPGEIRIIGGLWKRSKLPVPTQPGLRPTPDRVRETLFNWLGSDVQSAHCLDAFAGTGALGFEAASRGASQVRLVEQDSALVAQLQRMQAQFKADMVQVVRGDGLAALKSAQAQSLDLIFLDPPFEATWFETALAAATKALKPEGSIYLESPTAWSEAALAALNLNLHRYMKAGAVHAHVLRRIID
jgi:16S rRNA (guanine(966)-N(2))-methyltransferase RsmD